MKNSKNSLFRGAIALLLCVMLCFTAVCPALAVDYSLDGDVNGDGVIDANDLIAVKKALLFGYTDEQYDVNGDKTVDIRDLINIKKKIAYYIDGEKFAAKTVSYVGNAKAVTLGTLFSVVDGYTVDSSLVNIAVTPDDGVSYVYNANTENWENGTLDFDGTGSATVEIYEYCKATSITVTVEDEVKFAVNENAASSYGNASIITVGTLFSLVDGYTVDSAKVTVTAKAVDGDVTCAIVPNTENWENGAIEFDGTGNITLTITEESKPTEITVEIVDADKFALKVDDPHTVKNTETVVLGKIFSELEGVDVDSDKVEVNITKAQESDTVDWVLTTDIADWTAGTITFSGSGSINVTIEEDSNPTTLTIVVELTDKFTAKVDNTAEFNIADGAVELGDLFAAIDGAEIDSEKVTVTIDNGTYTANTTDWTLGTVEFATEGTATVTIAEDSNVVTVTVNVIDVYDGEKFAVKFENTEDYLYRVGNGNAVKLGSLFTAIDGVDIDSASVEVAVNCTNGNVTNTYTANENDWTASTVKFTGTGTVEISISEGSKVTTISVEVVNATNVTSYSELGNRNSVLLNNIIMSADSQYYLSNATLYGNGFKFNVTAGKNGNTTDGVISNNYVICLTNASVDNIQIIGAVYPEYGATVKEAYNFPAILTAGDCAITNSYVSNCSSPVRVKEGSLLISNTTLKGGNFANLDIRNGNVTLEDVTTINQVDSNETAADSVVVGLGIVSYYEKVLNTTTIEIKGTLTQYNYLAETDIEYISDAQASKLVEAMFGDDYAQYQYTDANGVKWVNTAIISMSDAVGESNIIDNRTDKQNYVGQSTSLMGYEGYVYSANSAPKTPDAEYAPTAQCAIAPSYSFDYTTKNYLEKTDGSNDCCYYDSTAASVIIGFDEGNSFTWDTSILTATKVGQTLDYTVSMNGTDYTGKSITFNTSGNYVVAYTYTDPNNYTVDADGNVTLYDKEYTQYVYISVSAVKSSAKSAEFTMGTTNAATEKLTIDDVTYISATGVTADNTTWTYMTIGDQKVYYPIIAAKLTATSGSKSYAYFPVFENAVTITDYADSGTGAAVTYNASTTTLPTNLTAVKGVYKAAADVTSWSNLTNSNLSQSGASKIFKWASSSDAPSAPEIYNSVLCYKSPEVSADRVEYITLVQYSYTDSTNTTYYYYVGYTLAAFDQSSCVTPDTLVTLADGTQKRIDAVTYEDKLLVWDFYNGEYAAVPSAIIFDHGYADNTVIALNFSDGTTVKVVNMHQFFSTNVNRFVTIDADNVAQYVGYEFVKQDGTGYKTVTLVDYTVTEEYIEAYGIISAVHYNILVEGMLSTDFKPQDYSLFNYFEVGNDMKYDAEKMQADIEKYGVYTYEEFADYLTYEQFVGFNVPYFKVAVGKGYYTFEGILNLIDEYLNK